MKELDYTVFPSEQKTISVEEDDLYGGAHYYRVVPSLGFNPETKQTEYVNGTYINIPFVMKKDDGTMIGGLQSEQLAFVLYDRCVKLNQRFPSPQNLKMIEGLEMFLAACRERVEDRMNRGIMGELKK